MFIYPRVCAKALLWVDILYNEAADYKVIGEEELCESE